MLSGNDILQRHQGNDRPWGGDDDDQSFNQLDTNHDGVISGMDANWSVQMTRVASVTAPSLIDRADYVGTIIEGFALHGIVRLEAGDVVIG